MKDVHVLKFKWLYNCLYNLDTKDYHFIAEALPTLRDNIYGLDLNQIEKLDLVYEKYKRNKNQVRIQESNPFYSVFRNWISSN